MLDKVGMIMGFLMSHTLFGCCVLALYFAVRAVRKLELRYKENVWMVILCISSAVWSFGFCGIMVQTNPDYAYYWRMVGMFGTFMFLIAGTILIAYLTEMPKLTRQIVQTYSYLGVVLYIGLAKKDLVIYEMASFGMTYSFKPSFWNSVYTLYSVVLAFIMLAALIRTWWTGEKKRQRVMAVKVLLGVVIVLLGMILDTIFPLMGIPAIPGSTFGQFVGLIVLYDAVLFINRFRMNVENMSQFVYYSLEVPILLYDSKKNLQLANSAANLFFDLEDGRLDQGKMEELFEAEEDVFRFAENCREIKAVCRKNQIYCSLAVNKICDDYGDVIGYIIIVSDLSEHMRTVAEMEEAIRSADRANAAKSTFLANMSHEIRTPMHAIIGFSELVMKLDINPQVREYMEDIKLASNNLLAIINDILDISKIESGKMEVLPVEYYTASLMKDVSLIITMQAENKGLGFKFEVAEDIPNQLYGDKVRLRGVLINVLNNAIKYTKEGSVSFQASVRRREGDMVLLEFKVSDTGIGIRQEEIGRLFKSFERLERKANDGIEGSGLGLAIANGYIRLMGGEIQVESTYGKGSVFTVLVPQKIVDEKPLDKSYIYRKEATEAKEENFRLDNVPVLVVDDNKVNLRVAQGIMNSYGMKVDVADGGAAAVELCTVRNYPLVFMDQMMPQIDGISAMRMIREKNPYYAKGGEGKIIVLTADAIGGVREQLLAEGFDEYIGKPLNIKQMERVILKFIPEEKVIRGVAEQEENQDEEQQEKALQEKRFQEELASKLPQIDVPLGVSRCGKSTGEYLQVLKITYEYGENRIQQLLEYQKAGNYGDYTIKVHSLKSTALNIGAVAISEMAKQQELAGKEGDYSFIDTHYEELIREYRKMLGDICQVLVENEVIKSPAPVQAPEGKIPAEYLDEEVVHQMLQSILEYLDEFEFNRIFQILEELKKCPLKREDSELFKDIGAAMDELLVDKVRELILKALEGKDVS